jgi:integrase
LANGKIETILITGMRIPKLINIKIDNYNLKKRGMLIKRLGIEIDNSRKVIIHIEGVYA